MGSGRGRKRRTLTGASRPGDLTGASRPGDLTGASRPGDLTGASRPGDDEFARRERMFEHRLRDRCARFPNHLGPQLLEAKVMSLVDGDEELEWQVGVFLSRGRDKISVITAYGPDGDGALVASGNGRLRGLAPKELERVVSQAQSMIEERRITRWQTENNVEISVTTLEEALKARGVIGDESALANAVDPQKQVF